MGLWRHASWLSLLFGLGHNGLIVHAVQMLLNELPNTIAQCQPLPVHWSFPQGEQSSRFNITFLPFNSFPFNLTVNPSNQDAGDFAATLPFSSGTSFLVAGGSGSNATTSNIVTVTPSSNTSCLNPNPASPDFILKSSPSDCSPKLFNMTCVAANCTDIPVVRGFVPNGQAPFPVAAVGFPAQWFISVQEQTQVLLEFSKDDGHKTGTSGLFTIGGPEAVEKCDTFVFFASSNITTQQNLPAKPSPSVALASRTIIGIVIGGTVGVTALLWILFFLRRYLKQRQKSGKLGPEGGTGGTRTMTDRDFVLDSEFGITFTSMMASSRGTMTLQNAKGPEKPLENQLARYSRSNVTLPLEQGNRETKTQFHGPNLAPPRVLTRPPPIRVPSYVPMDVVAELRKSDDPSVSQGNLSPSLLPEWARRTSSQRSTTTTAKRQTRESGRVV